MKKFLLFLLLITGMATLSQTRDKSDSNRIKRTKEHHKQISGDSLIKKLQQMKDSVAAANKMNSDQNPESISRNMDAILQLQKERKEKQKKAALARIGIGVIFLLLLIISWRRRRRK